MIFLIIFLILAMLGIAKLVSPSKKAPPVIYTTPQNNDALSPSIKAQAGPPDVSVDEIIVMFQSQRQSYKFIPHFTDADFMKISDALNKNQLRSFFKMYNETGFRFPMKSYAFIQAKLNNQVWFDDDEFAAREAAGKRTTYITEDDLLVERFEEIFYNNNIEFEQKMVMIDELICKKSKKVRLGNKISMFEIAYDYVKERNNDEESKRVLRNLKTTQSKAHSRLELKEEDINFRALDEQLRCL
jgi:hypothetical protein